MLLSKSDCIVCFCEDHGASGPRVSLRIPIHDLEFYQKGLLEKIITHGWTYKIYLGLSKHRFLRYILPLEIHNAVFSYILLCRGLSKTAQ